MKNGKLHELLAVEKNIKVTADKIIKETNLIFGNAGHFEGFVRKYEPINSEDNEVFDTETKEVITTVNDKLYYFSKNMEKLFDIIIQKEVTNTLAFSDIIIKDEKGTTLAEKVPVTVLVQFEKILEGIKGQVYNSIPTLNASKKYDLDTQQKNMFITPSLRKLRTKKIPKAFELSPATKEHPAQVQAISEDVPTGYWWTTEWSGMISPAEKSDILTRLDLIISAIKTARARANNIEVQNVRIGQKIFNYIQKGL